MLEDYRLVDRSRSETSGSTYSRASLKTTSYSPPPVVTRAIQPSIIADKRNGEAAKSSFSSGGNVGALRAFRRARGLCFTCGEKWDPQHKCGQTVQLHVVQELVEMLQGDETEPESRNLLHQEMSQPSMSCYPCPSKQHMVQKEMKQYVCMARSKVTMPLS